MASIHSEAAMLSKEIAKDICKNEKVENFISGASGPVVGKAVTVATGNPIAGLAAGAITSGLSRSHKQEVAETAATVGVNVAISAASVILAPVLIVGFIFDSLFGD